MSVVRCTYRMGNHRCRAFLIEHVDRLGRLTWDCPACARRVAGVCAECPQPVAGAVGRALRCATHVRVALNRADARWRERNPALYHRIARESNRAVRDRHRGGPPMSKAAQVRLMHARRQEVLTPAQRSAIAKRAGQAAARNRRARQAAA